MNFDDFQKILCQQKPSDKDGFEGLVAKLLEKLTGQRFYLSLPGRQEGKDMSSSGQRGNSLAVECKRYEDSTSLPSDKLLAKFAAAGLSSPPPDLWMVVTTKRLGEQHHSQLKRASQESGIAYFSVDAEGDEDSFLCALCAHAPDIVANHLNNSELKVYLENLKYTRPTVQAQIEHLKQELLAENIGYEHWRTTQNTWLIEQFSDENKARAAFCQNLAVSNQDPPIPRKAAFERLDEWRNKWSSTLHPLIILGEEGDGKTWAVATWLSNCLRDVDFPPILFLSATQVGTDNTLTLISETLNRQLGEPRERYWEKRLQYWLKRSTCSPVLLLVLDGLNERSSFKWTQLFDDLANYNQVAVLATCRKIFWEESLSNCLSSSVLPPWTLEPYDDNELALALKQKQLARDEFNEKLVDLLRKPRYFDLTVRLRSKLSTEGEITIERLIYEDQRDKYSRKGGASQLLSHKEFQEFISHLAEKQNKFLSRKQVVEELSGYGENYSSRLEELITSGILIQKGNKWEINHHSLILGLGLLLAYGVENVAHQSKTEITEVVAHHLEPQADMDIKVSICGMALYHSLAQVDFPEVGRLVLFQSWINGRNISEEDWRRVPAYLPLSPETYLAMAEQLWSSHTENSQAQDIFMYGFLKYRKTEKVKTALIPAFQRWMGFVFPDGHVGRHFRAVHNEKELIKSQQMVREALDQKEVIPGVVSLFAYQLNIIEDEGLLRLAEVVLAVISHGDCVPYLQAIVTGVIAGTVMGYIAGTVMGYPDFRGQLTWVLHTAPDDIEHPLLDAAKKLLQHPQATAKKSAWWLLKALGTEEACTLREQIPKEFHFKDAGYQKETPCQFSWTQDNYLECLEKEFHPDVLAKNLKPDVLAKNLKNVALNPECTVPNWLPKRLMQVGENINLNQVCIGRSGQTPEDTDLQTWETTLCAYQPRRYAELLCTLARQFPNRPANSRHHLGRLLYEHMLIMGEEERLAIDAAWRKSILTGKEEDNEIDNKVFTEKILFPCVLRGRDLLTQLQFVEERWRGHDLLTPQLQFIKKHGGRFVISSNYTPFPQQKIKPRFQRVEPRFFPQLTEKLKQLHTKGQHYDLLCGLHDVLSYLDDSLRKLILDIFQSDEDSRIRSCCLQIIIATKDSKAADQAILESHWKAEPNNEDRESEHYLESKLLCEFGQTLPFSEIIERVLPQLLGYAVQQRGNIREEVLAYAEVLHHVWSAFGDGDKRVEPWFFGSFKDEGLSEVVDACPQLVEQWWEDPSSSSIMARCQGFYEALCHVLLQKHPEIGCKLFKRLHENKSSIINDPTTGIRNLLFGPFVVENSEPVDQLRKELLEKATRDMELFELVFLAQREGKQGWLKDTLEEYLASRWPFKIGLGIQLLGFLDTQEEVANRLSAWIERPDSWLRDVAKLSQGIYQRNQWARHWFDRFVNHDNDLDAWAAFRLFLQCVDRRFWLWGPEMLEKVSIQSQRLEHYRACYEVIRKAIKDNEEEKFSLKRLIGHEVYGGQLWPWGRYGDFQKEDAGASELR